MSVMFKGLEFVRFVCFWQKYFMLTKAAFILSKYTKMQYIAKYHNFLFNMF